jgi:hypothetical protein
MSAPSAVFGSHQFVTNAIPWVAAQNRRGKIMWAKREPSSRRVPPASLREALQAWFSPYLTPSTSPPDAGPSFGCKNPSLEDRDKQPRCEPLTSSV